MAKEYIERGALIANLERFAPEHLTRLLRDLISKQPAADVVEVVRCGLCLYSDELTDDEVKIYNPECVMCRLLGLNGTRIPMFDNAYCYMGRRKDGGDSD